MAKKAQLSKPKKPENTADMYSAEMQKTARLNNTYTQVMQSLTKCPFCDLKSKYFVKELEHMVLTVNLFPYVDGHLMVIPKRHISVYEDISPVEHLELITLVKYAKKRIQEVLSIKGFNVLYREGNDSGSSLGHLHIHIIPTPTIMLVPQHQEIKLTTLEMAQKLRE